MKIEIVEVKDILEWDKFVENSNQNNVFSKSIFLSNWFEKYKIFFVRNGLVSRLNIFN